MKIEIEKVVLGLVAAFVLAISSARADDAAAMGKVRKLYSELARDVLMEGVRPGKPLWADVEIAGGGRPNRMMMVRIPAALTVQAGDLIEVAVANRTARSVGSMPEVTQATQVAAKGSTPQAQAWDVAPRRTASLF